MKLLKIASILLIPLLAVFWNKIPDLVKLGVEKQRQQLEASV